jgi:hypothetical protein
MKQFTNAVRPDNKKTGEGGIRTRGAHKGTLVFETSSISRSDTSPDSQPTGHRKYSTVRYLILQDVIYSEVKKPAFSIFINTKSVFNTISSQNNHR